jgi:hypothetical protein
VNKRRREVVGRYVGVMNWLIPCLSSDEGENIWLRQQLKTGDEETSLFETTINKDK